MIMFQKLSLRSKLLFIFIPLLIVSLSIVGFTSYSSARVKVLADSVENIKNITKNVIVELEVWIKDRQRDINLFSEDEVLLTAFSSNDLNKVRNKLEKLHSHSPIYENIFLATKDGVLFVDSIQGKSVGVELQNIPIYKPNVEAAKRGESFLSPVAKSPATGRPVALLTKPILKDDKLIGMIGTPIELNAFSEFFIDPIKFGESGYLTVVDAEGVALAHPNKELILNFNIRGQDWGEMLFKNNSGQLKYTFNNEEKVGYFETSSFANWVVFGTISAHEVEATIDSIKRNFFISLIGSILLTIIILVLATNKLFKLLDNTLCSLTKSAVAVRDTGVKILESGKKLDTINQDQAAAQHETSSSIQEVSAMVEKTNESAKSSKMFATQSRDISINGLNTVKDMVASIVDIEKTNESLVSTVEENNQRFSKIVDAINTISDKTHVITDIVFQTKLLSFNASVEAARAGEQGKGFSVVAEEVGNLAEVSGKASNEISSILVDNIKLVEDTVQRVKDDLEIIMRQVKEKISEGNARANSCNVIFEEINLNTQKITSTIDEISLATNEQTQGVSEILKAMERLNKLLDTNNSISRESIKLGEELHEQSLVLDKNIELLSQNFMGKCP